MKLTEKTEKRSVTIDGKKTSIIIRPSVWKKWQELIIGNRPTPASAIYASARQAHNGTWTEAITAYVEHHTDEPLYHFDTREKWLGMIVDAMRPVFEERGYKLPEKIRVSVGFTSKGWRGKARGECWETWMSADGYCQIFLDPTVMGEEMLANILTHELCHAYDDCKSGHGKVFKRCGEAMNLEGKPKHMLGGDAWRAWAKPIIDAVGPIPHGSIQAFVAKPKKQNTRMLKCECPSCGFTFRTARKWLESKDFLICPDQACAETIHLDTGEEEK